jgi:thioesterase domain-containing protein
MNITNSGYDRTPVRLHAPLQDHVNDKACAFGGSLASMMTLASWGVVSLKLHELDIDADVYVADSQLRYLAPLFADLDVTAQLGPDADADSFITTLRERGRARTQLVARAMTPEGAIATEFTARYVAIART